MTPKTIGRISALPNRVLGTYFVLIALSLSASANQPGDDTDGNLGIAPLFAVATPLQVIIEAPLTTLIRDRPEKEYLNGTFRFTGDDGIERTLNLKLRTRGNYRREEEHCDFAPTPCRA